MERRLHYQNVDTGMEILTHNPLLSVIIFLSFNGQKDEEQSTFSCPTRAPSNTSTIISSMKVQVFFPFLKHCPQVARNMSNSKNYTTKHHKNYAVKTLEKLYKSKIHSIAKMCNITWTQKF